MTIIGIDLGTTNSLVSVWQNSESLLIPNALGQYLTPSVVGLTDKGDVIIGEAARIRLQTHPKLTTARFKQFIGSDKVVTLGKRQFRSEELSALVLKSLKQDAESFLGHSVRDAVISVPAYFNDIQRTATGNAAKIAGLTVKRLINEPTAAAIAYGLHEKQDATFIVFDIGGGTFDVSILELFDGVMQVTASTGDNRLGGEDFDDLLMQWCCEQGEITMGSLSLKELAQLRFNCHAAKVALTTTQKVEIPFAFGGKKLSLGLDRAQFASLVEPLVQRLRKPLERALFDSKIEKAELDAVVLVGGASRMQVVRSLVSRLLGLIPKTHINPDEIVAKGIAVQIGLMEDDVNLSEVVLTDVAPYSLGIGISNGNQREQSLLFHPIIERNSPVPVSRSDVFYTVSDQQEVVRCKVFQGESRLTDNNILLGQIEVPVPKKPKGEESVDIRFTYDINGLLEVQAKVLSTGEETAIIIKGNNANMSDQEIQQRLASLNELKIHPREQTQYNVQLLRGYRLFEDLVGETRLMLGQVLEEFERVLERQDNQEIVQFSQYFDEVLLSLKPLSPLK